MTNVNNLVQDDASTDPTTQERSNSSQTQKIKAEEKPGKRLKNPLGYYASSSYQITLYMVTPDAYDLFVQSGRKNINILSSAKNDIQITGFGGSGPFQFGPGAYIVAQTGGVNNANTKRAPYFNLDYYIDNLKITTATNGKSTLTATNTVNMSFQIIEPYGFSFITNLKRAGDALKQYNDTVGYKNLANASRQFFILGIKFYGYDINGNIITGSTIQDGQILDPQGTNNGSFEHFYDIVLTKISFKLDGRSVVYSITAAATAPQAAYGLKRGIVKESASLEGVTIRDFLEGEKGLFTILSKREEDSRKRNEISIANRYKVEFLDDAKQRIAESQLLDKAAFNKYVWGGSTATKTVESNDGTAVKSSPNSNKAQFMIDTGTPILQALTKLISNSSYVLDALKTVYNSTPQPDPVTGELIQKPNPNPKPISWYNVSVELRNPEFDKKTNDWAYEMVFKIQTYETPVIFSAYTNPGMQYYGPHKRYEYWFTGKNSEIIEYTQNFDNTYFNVALNPDPLSDPRTQSNDTAATQSGQVAVTTGLPQGDTQTRIGTGTQAQNSYVTSLYDPGSYAEAKLKILGDPDFLISESSTSINDLYSRFYGVNGYTINANGGQVFIEVDFKEAVDYEHNTGTLSVNDSILFWEYPASIQKLVKGVSYMVIEVVSNFQNGKFTQDLKCVINTFPGTLLAQEATELNTGRAAEQTADSGAATSGAAPADSQAGRQTAGLTPAPSAPRGARGPGARLSGSNDTGTVAPNSTNDDNSSSPVAPTTPQEGREPTNTSGR